VQPIEPSWDTVEGVISYEEKAVFEIILSAGNDENGNKEVMIIERSGNHCGVVTAAPP
jgi:hypothetical protein